MKKKGKAVIFFGFLFLGIWIATQTFAKGTNYHRSLGAPIFVYQNTSFYNPFSIVRWLKYGNTAPKSLSLAQRNFILTQLISISILGILSKKGNKGILGSAKWGTTDTIRDANLYLDTKKSIDEYKRSGMYEVYTEGIRDKDELYEDGVVLGLDNRGKTILHQGGEHIMMMAPTRAGKGVGVIIPTLLTWKGSSVVLDIKGENWEITSRYRRSIGQRCLKFNPTSEESCSYNPLNEIRRKTINEYDDARIIAEIICTTNKPDHWSKSATDYLTGVIIYIIYSMEDGSLSDVVDFINAPLSIEEKVAKMSMDLTKDNTLFKGLYGEEKSIRYFYYKDEDGDSVLDTEESSLCHPKVVACANDIYAKATKERDSIISTAKTNISTFQSPVIARNTKKSDFKIKDLMNDTLPVNLYLVTPPRSLDIISPLFRILITQIIYGLTAEVRLDQNNRNIAYKHRLLLLLDEFPSIGKVPLIEKALAFISGYGIKALIIAQDLNQINRIYTRENSILSNCFVTVLYTPARMDDNTLTLVSKSLGNSTVNYKTRSWKGMKYLSDWNYSEQLRERRLMTEGEVATFDRDKNLILVNGYDPIQGNKIKYYESKKYLKRLKRGEEYES